MVQCGGTIGDMMVSGEFFQSILCTFSQDVGLIVFAGMVYGALGISLYISTGSAILPLVLTVILGGVVVPFLPGPFVQFVGVVVLLLIAGGGYYLVTSRGPAAT
jgi:hypothetical protein